jgi:predicted RNA-binding protein YlqC (UPF0109 family)
MRPGTNDLVVPCAQHLVGRIIGRGGETIRDLQTRTGCSIQINQVRRLYSRRIVRSRAHSRLAQNFPDGVNREVTISGPLHLIDHARELVLNVMTNGPTALLSAPTGTVAPGAYIGGAPPSLGLGSTVGLGMPPHQPMMTGNSMGAPPSMGMGAPPSMGMGGMGMGMGAPPSMGMGGMGMGMGAPPSMGMGGMGMGMRGGYESSPSITQVMDCPQSMVGRVIGKGGDTIRQLQMQSGCRIQIDQTFPDGHPRKITIQGSPSQVQHAIQLVTTKVTEQPIPEGAIVQVRPFHR